MSERDHPGSEGPSAGALHSVKFQRKLKALEFIGSIPCPTPLPADPLAPGLPYTDPVPRRPQIAVLGAHAPSERLARESERLGRLLVDAGCRVITGGLAGVMEAASKGAASSSKRQGGDVIGLLPGLDPAAANPWVEIVIPTGLSLARNVLCVSSADAVIACGGRAGTLSEIAMAWQLGKPVVALDLEEGWASELAGRAIDDRREDEVVRATSAEAAVQAVLDALA